MRTNDEIMDILDRLKDEKNLSISEIARQVGMAKSAVSRYFNRTREFPLNRVGEFAKVFNIEPSYLIGLDFEQPSNIIFPEKILQIPVVGQIAAGSPITAEQNIESYIPVISSNVPSGDLICLNVNGDSMSPGIPNKSCVMIRLQDDIEDGEIAAVLVNGDTEATLKRVKRQNGLMILIPDNSDYEPLIITEETPARIIGKAVQVIYNL